FRGNRGARSFGPRTASPCGRDLAGAQWPAPGEGGLAQAVGSVSAGPTSAENVVVANVVRHAMVQAPKVLDATSATQFSYWLGDKYVAAALGTISQAEVADFEAQVTEAGAAIVGAAFPNLADQERREHVARQDHIVCQTAPDVVQAFKLRGATAGDRPGGRARPAAIPPARHRPESPRCPS
ncbi:MAG: hypothetical protein ACRDZW_10710, partial [Acidimicrobiales bacterium]